MTTFAGIVRFDGGPENPQTEAWLRAAIGASDQERVFVGRRDGAVFAQRAAATHGAAAGTVDADDGRDLFAASVRLDNCDDVKEALALSGPASDAVLLRRMIERWGDAGVARCLGAFAFASWDADARRLLLGRDCLGGRALFFHRAWDFVAFATTPAALLALPGVPRAIDDVTLANFMIVNLTEPRRTFYRGIERVSSRTLVTIDRRNVTHRHYWEPGSGTGPPMRRAGDYIARTRELLDQAVAATLADTPHVAIATSGGLDSSAIAATAARLGRADKITCYSLVLPPDTHIDVGPHHYPDERGKVDALARLHPGLDVRYLAPEALHPFERDDTRHFAGAGVPALSPAILGTYGFLHDAVAAAGHGALLTGSFGNHGLSWSGRFSLLALLRSGSAAAFGRELCAVSRQSGRGLARTLAGDVVMPAIPAGLRRSMQRWRGRRAGMPFTRALNPAFIAEHDLSRQWRSQGFDPWFGVSGWNAARHRARLLFDHNQCARDMQAMCLAMRGHEMRAPLGDRRLADFLLSVPEPMFRRNGVPRAFAREVLADRLPPEILNERRRGAQAVTWYRRLDARRPDIAADLDRLEASPLARRMIDLPHLKQLMAQWPADEHAASPQMASYALALSRGVHIGRFIRWVENGSA